MPSSISRDTKVSFFGAPKKLSIDDIANDIDAEFIENGVAAAEITNVASLSCASFGDVTFFDNPKYLDDLKLTQGTLCICAAQYKSRIPKGVGILVVKDPYRAFAKITARLYPRALRPQPITDHGTISDQAFIAPSARLEENVTVEPFAVIGENAHIGANTLIGSGTKIGCWVKLGRDCIIASHCVVEYALLGNRVILHPSVMIGQDGFGFAMSPVGHMKVPQVGRVIIQDDVDIGSNTTVDRGANRDTMIGEGTKIDNQVQIGHNVVIGRHCVIVAQVGISGSTTLEDFVAIGGQTGINGHVTIGRGAQIAAVSVVHGDVPSGARWGGVPARPIREWFREQQLLKRMVRGHKMGGNEAKG